MNRDLELKLQAYVDGELMGREAARVEDWVEANPEAEALLAGLRGTKELLAGGELERQLPETREFFWSKIEREIERTERVEDADATPGWLVALRRLLIPAAGVAVVALLAVATFRFFEHSDENYYLTEVENSSEEMGSYSFHSTDRNVFVVWVYERGSQNAGEPESASDMPLK